MLPYISLLMLVMSWMYLEEKSLNRKSIYVTTFILVAFASIRHYTVGTDTPSYTFPFRMNIDPDYLSYDIRIELGYQFLLHQLLSFTHKYYVLFVVVSMLSIVPVIVTLRRMSTNYKLSIFVFITFGFYLNVFNPERQSIAMGICFLALPYLIEKKFSKYLFIVFISSLFHISAWLMLPMYFVCHVNIRDSYKVISCLAVSYLGSSVLISYLAKGNDRYVQYTEKSLDGPQGRATLYFYILLAIIVYFFGKIRPVDNVVFKNCRTLFICGVAGLVPIAMLSTDPSGPQRILGYFAYGLMIILPMILDVLKSTLIKYLFVICSVTYFILIVYKLGGVYPYKINELFMVL